MHTIGKIDIGIFRVVSDNIREDEVILTDERMAHVEEHHKGDYEKYSSHIAEMLANPKYVLEDKTPNTAVILHEFSNEGQSEYFRMVVKLAVVGDDPSRKNSLITFFNISEKTYKKYLKNKKVLYKLE